jgi:hypothetical protein
MEKNILMTESFEEKPLLSSRSAKFKALNSKVKDLYKTNYNKIDTNSIKYLEYKNMYKKYSKECFYTPKSLKPKQKILTKLKKDHINLNNENYIFTLPKSPWGSHKSYNDQINFTETHFKSKESQNDNKVKEYKRKLTLLTKIINKTAHRKVRLEKFQKIKENIFKTKSGNMHCKRQLEAENIYEKANENYRKIKEFKFENSKEINHKLHLINAKYSKKATATDEIVKRLYTPSPKKSLVMDEKYKQLFEV